MMEQNMKLCNNYLSGRVSERHPLPWAHPALAYFSLHLLVALVCVCWYHWWCIPVPKQE